MGVEKINNFILVLFVGVVALFFTFAFVNSVLLYLYGVETIGTVYKIDDVNYYVKYHDRCRGERIYEIKKDRNYYSKRVELNTRVIVCYIPNYINRVPEITAIVPWELIMFFLFISYLALFFAIRGDYYGK